MVLRDRSEPVVEAERVRAFYAGLARPPVVRPALLRALRFFAGALPTCGPVLEVGCGAGHLAMRLDQPGRRVVALDVSLGYVRYARARYPGLRAVVGDALALPFGAGTFAAVYSHEHIEHVVDPRRALEEQWRVLAPGGRLLLVAPNLAGPLPALRYAGYLLSRGYLWRPSPVDGARLPAVLWEAVRNTVWTMWRCAWRGARFVPRRPDLSGPPHGDSDATWWCNSRDVWELVAALGGQRLLRTAGRTGWLGPFAATVYVAAEKASVQRSPRRQLRAAFVGPPGALGR